MRARQVIFTGPGKVSLETIEVGRPDEDQVLIETLYSAISPGTERAHLLAMPNTATHARGFPFPPGYSNVGRVVEVGGKVRNFRPGQLVATTRPHVSHVLLPATSGSEPLPEKYRAQFQSPIAPETPSALHYLWPLPDGLDPKMLKACATFGISKVGLLGVRRARVELGECVLVLGLGPIGLYAAQYARLAGGFPVIGLELSADRRKIGREIGMDAAYADEAELAQAQSAMHGKGPAVVIEITGRPEAIPIAFRASARMGRVVLLGSTRGVTYEVNFYSDVHRKGLTVFGAHELTRPFQESMPGNWTSWEDAELIFRLIRSGRLNCAPLLTHEFPVEQAAEAYEVVRNSQQALMVILDWTS